MTLDSRTYNKLIEWKNKTNVSTLSISLNDKKKYFILSEVLNSRTFDFSHVVRNL